MLLDLRNPIRLAREPKPGKHILEEMGTASILQRSITLAGSRLYTSMVNTATIIDEALSKFETVLEACIQAKLS